MNFCGPKFCDVGHTILIADIVRSLTLSDMEADVSKVGKLEHSVSSCVWEAATSTPAVPHPTGRYQRIVQLWMQPWFSREWFHQLFRWVYETWQQYKDLLQYFATTVQCWLPCYHCVNLVCMLKLAQCLFCSFCTVYFSHCRCRWMPYQQWKLPWLLEYYWFIWVYLPKWFPSVWIWGWCK